MSQQRDKFSKAMMHEKGEDESGYGSEGSMDGGAETKRWGSNRMNSSGNEMMEMKREMAKMMGMITDLKEEALDRERKLGNEILEKNKVIEQLTVSNSATEKLKQHAWPSHDHFSTAVAWRRVFSLQIDRAKAEGIPYGMIANSISNHFVNDAKIAQKFGDLANKYDTSSLDGVILVIDNLNPGEASLSAETKFNSLQMLKTEDGLDYINRLSASHDDFFSDTARKPYMVKKQFLANFKHNDQALNDHERQILGAYSNMNEMVMAAKNMIIERVEKDKEEAREALELNVMDDAARPPQRQQHFSQNLQFAPHPPTTFVEHPTMAPHPVPTPTMVPPTLPQRLPPALQSTIIAEQQHQQGHHQPQQERQTRPFRNGAIRRPMMVQYKDRVPAGDQVRRVSIKECFA